MNKLAIPLAIIIGALIIGAFIYFAISKQSKFPQPSPTPISSPQQIEALPTPTPVPTQTPSVDDSAQVRAALAQKLGTSESALDIQITDKRPKWAKGLVKEKTSEVGGGYFLAAKTDSNWIIVYDGQANPTCAQIAPYNFPTDMVPECLDSGNNVLKR